MSGRRIRDGQAGVVLVNVLAVLAISATVVAAMVRVSDVAVARSQRYGDAAQALALIAAGEASAIAVLRRDMAEAPGADHLQEPWAHAGQEPVAVESGTFALRIEDAQARINLNALTGAGGIGAGAGAQALVQRMATALDLPPGTGLRIAARLALPAPLDDLADLGPGAGLTAGEVAALATLATALPGKGQVNLNTAPPEVLAVLAANPVQALQIDGIRSRQGQVTAADLASAGIARPFGAGFATRLFRVTVTVRTGDVTLTREALVQRRQGPGGAPEVAVIARRAVEVPLF